MIYKNIIRLCEYRGGIIKTKINADEHLRQMETDHYVIIHAERGVSNIRESSHIAVAQFHKEPTIEKKLDTFKRFLDKLIRAQPDDMIEYNIILVTSSTISGNIQNIIDATNISHVAKKGKIFVEHVLASKLSIIVPEHVAVPKHEIVPSNEAEKIFSELHISRANIPKLITSGSNADPVAIWLGFRAGMLIKIRRPAETSGYMVFYRLCV
jgi:DNA-directed RNA polymerase subunit H